MRNNKKYLIEFLQEYKKRESFRFHMPGHKGKNLDELKEIFPYLDITEISSSDDLHYPEGVIKNSEERAANIFGAKETIFMVNGSTSSIYSAIMGTVKEGEKIIMQRDSHKSAYNALILGNIFPEYIYPEYDQILGISLGISLKTQEERLRKLLRDRKVKAVFITYPNYYGITCELEELVKIVHEYEKILIVDEAHGSHLKFDKRLPKSAIDLGADIVIQSNHKTLIGLTQTSLIHICSDRISSDKIRKFTRIHQSSSPSYILMASLDLCMKEIENNNCIKKLKRTIDFLEDKIYSDSSINMNLINKDYLNKKGFDLDIMKIVFRFNGLNGKQIESIMRKECNLELEMSDHKNGVAICTFMDSEEDIDKLKNSILYLKKQESKDKDESYGLNYFKIKKGENYISPRKAFYMEKINRKLDDCVGEISGSIVTPYPPGIPILSYGEIIDKNIIENIKYLLNYGINIQGIENNEICCCKIGGKNEW